MTPKQARFVAEYLVDHNATQAAIRAGYSEHTATVQGSRLLTLPDVAEAVGEQEQSTAEKLGLTAEWVITRLQENAENSDKPSDRNKALELLARHLGLFVERVRHEGGISIMVNGVDVEDLV